jgi:hypothetical protein
VLSVHSVVPWFALTKLKGYFFVSYVKILKFKKKIFLIGPLLGEVRKKKKFKLGQNFFFIFFNYGPFI